VIVSDNKNGVVVATPQPEMSVVERAVALGDLAKLTSEERTVYYVELCRSVGLNPMTQPFSYLTLNGKLVLYTNKGATDQLRNIHGVSVVELTESERDGVFVVTAKVIDRQGRTDMAKGAVNIANLKGEALANALMKAETKAKRRATLSVCGLGFLDESEVHSIPDAIPVQADPAPALANTPPPPSGATILANDEQRKQIDELCDACGVGDEEYIARLPAICGQADPAKLTAAQAEKVIKGLKSRLAKIQEQEKAKVAS
jgi:hypothetical protein